MQVGERKISGSAYKLKLGRSNGFGRRSLHHGTMLLNLDLTCLGKYLNPNKKKLESKGVDSVVSRVMNLVEANPEINHDNFSASLTEEFTKRWAPVPVNKQVITEQMLKSIP